MLVQVPTRVQCFSIGGGGGVIPSLLRPIADLSWCIPLGVPTPNARSAGFMPGSPPPFAVRVHNGIARTTSMSTIQDRLNSMRVVRLVPRQIPVPKGDGSQSCGPSGPPASKILPISPSVGGSRLPRAEHTLLRGLPPDGLILQSDWLVFLLLRSPRGEGLGRGGLGREKVIRAPTRPDL